MSKQREFLGYYRNVIEKFLASFNFDQLSWVQKQIFDKALVVERGLYSAPELKITKPKINYTGATTTVDTKTVPSMPVFQFDPSLYSFQNVENASIIMLGSMFLVKLDKTHPDPADYENAFYKYHKLQFQSIQSNANVSIPTDMQIADPTAYAIYNISMGSMIVDNTLAYFSKTLSDGRLDLYIIAGRVSAVANATTTSLDIVVVELFNSLTNPSLVKGLRFLDQSCDGSNIVAILHRGFGAGLKLICKAI